MSSATTCSECAVQILVSTASKTGGRCMPCRGRPRVPLTSEQEASYETARSRYEHAGWKQDLAEYRYRIWLDFCVCLRRDIVRRSHGAWKALSACALEVSATKEPGLDVELALSHLRATTGGLFPAEHVREEADDPTGVVRFELSGRSYTIVVPGDGRTNMGSILAAANEALQHTSCTHRFLPLGREERRLLVAFARPETLQRSAEEGLCPSPA